MNNSNQSLKATDLSAEFFHLSDRSYTLGDCKPAGTYGTALEDDKICDQNNDPLGEYLRETIRASHYPSKPSRLKSTFVFETLDDALTYRTLKNQKGPVYKVRYVDQTAPFHRVCWSAFKMDSGIPLCVQAHEFWRNPPVYQADNEVFAESSIQILQESARALP